MSSTLLYITIVLALIVVEGMFVASEIALVSMRDSQVRGMAETSRRGAAVARLTSDPNRFLATVQIGVTLTSLLSSAFGAVTLSEQAKDSLVDHGVSNGLAGPIGFIGVTLLISFVTLVVGELVPKRLGLQRAEGTARLVSPTLDRLATASRPLIWLLSRSTNVLVRLLGGDPKTGREAITEEELRGLVAAHESLTSDERRLIDDVFAAGERSVSEVMVPRTEVTFLDAGLTVSRAAKVATDSPHSRYPVVGRGQDDVRGFVHIRDLLLNGARDRPRPHRRRPRPRGQATARFEERARRVVGDAPRGASPGDRGRRVRRHGRHRHARGPDRGGHRRHPRRVRRRPQSDRRASAAARSRSTAGSISTSSPSPPGWNCPTARTRRPADTSCRHWAGCPPWATRSNGRTTRSPSWRSMGAAWRVSG